MKVVSLMKVWIKLNNQAITSSAPTYFNLHDIVFYMKLSLFCVNNLQTQLPLRKLY